MNSVRLENLINPLPAKSKENITKAIFFNLQIQEEKKAFAELLQSSDVQITDTIYNQLSELISMRFPASKFTDEELDALIANYVNDTSLKEYGIWVYYPWNNYAVHLLDKEEFTEVRTNRNKYKITGKEQQLLKTKTIGIIGMSVGQTIASVLAIESLCGEIRIADFDTLELSNCNRLKTSLKNLGLHKTVIAAREISEIDPFINVVCYNEGITEENIDLFFNEGGKIDLLLEECDSINIKFLARETAKKYHIPVVMETNDRGMIDIERYDLDNDYPLFHGLLGSTTHQQLKQLNEQQRINYVLKIVGAFTASTRSKVSLLELGQSIINFPQLASSVFLGGAICADTVRRILLGYFKSSGRFYVDIEGIIKEDQQPDISFKPDTPLPLTEKEMHDLADGVLANVSSAVITKELAEQLVFDAAHAPSSGNDQPWIWLCRNNSFFLFHNINRSFSFGDYNSRASYTSLGAAIENFTLSAEHHSYKTSIKLFPTNDARLVAAINLIPFKEDNNKASEHLYRNILKRHTNRKILERKIIPENILNDLKHEAESVDKIHVDWITDSDKLTGIGKIISACDRMRLLNLHGHYDFFNREIRFTDEELMSKKTGMGIDDLAIPNDSLLALKILSDENIIKVLNDFNGGNALRNVSVLNTKAASAMCLITAADYTRESFIAGGRAMERQWLKAAELSVAYHPMVAPLYFFPRIIFGNGEGLNNDMQQELKELRKDFLSIFPGNNLRGEIALIRIFVPDEGEPKAPRLELKDVLIYNK